MELEKFDKQLEGDEEELFTFKKKDDKTLQKEDDEYRQFLLDSMAAV